MISSSANAEHGFLRDGYHVSLRHPSPRTSYGQGEGGGWGAKRCF
jgi:hypothetical protein